jgi:hypothetical protein
MYTILQFYIVEVRHTFNLKSLKYLGLNALNFSYHSVHFCANGRPSAVMSPNNTIPIAYSLSPLTSTVTSGWAISPAATTRL